MSVPTNREEFVAFIQSTTAILNALATMTPEQMSVIMTPAKLPPKETKTRSSEYYKTHKEEIAKRRKEQREAKKKTGASSSKTEDDGEASIDSVVKTQ